MGSWVPTMVTGDSACTAGAAPRSAAYSPSAESVHVQCDIVHITTISGAPLDATTQNYQVHSFNIVQWLDNTFPSWLMAVFIIGGGALLTWVAVSLRHRHADPTKADGTEPDTSGEAESDPPEERKSDTEHEHDLTGVFVSIVTLMYSVLVAFMIITVWTNYDRLLHCESVEPRAAGNSCLLGQGV